MFWASIGFGQVIPDFTYQQYCDSLVFTDATTINGSEEITSWEWELGEGATAIGPNAMHVYSGQGSYNVKLTVFYQNPIGQVEITKAIEIYKVSSAGITSESIVCVGYPLDFEGNANTNSNAFFPDDSLKWDFEDDGTWDAFGWNVTHIYSSAGTKTVRFEAVNNLGCVDDDTKSIDVIDGPDADFSADPVCVGNGMDFTNTSSLNGSGSFVEFYWDFENDGIWDKFVENPTHVYPMPGNYQVKFKVVTDIGCSDSTLKPVTVYELPIADFNYNSQCPEVMIQFSEMVTPNAAGDVTYFWDFGGYTSTDPNPQYQYDANGTYDVYLEVTNSNGCVHDTTKQILIEKPTADFDFDIVCFGQTTFFTDQSTFTTSQIIEWSWDFGDGSGTSNIANPNYNFANHGVYNVSLIVENDLGCTDDSIIPVLVDTLPTASFTHTASCAGMETCFTDESIANADTIDSWIWNFGDGNISTLKNPCHVFNSIGDYTITLVVVNSDGCSSQPFIENIYVAGQPDADFDAITSCFGDTAYFTNLTDTVNTEIDYWHWDFGDPASMGNNTSALYEPAHLFTTPGPFTVSLSVENIYGCADMIEQTVTIDSLPEANFTMPDTVAHGIEIILNDQSIGHGSPVINRMWDFGDGTTASNINPVMHTYNTPGVYEICLEVADFNGCSDEFCDSIVITEYPEAAFTYASDVTLESFFFDESTPGNTITEWYWDFGDPTTSLDTSTAATPNWTYPEEGWYEVYLKVWDRFGGYDDIVQMVYAGNAVIADFQHQFVCLGDTTMFVDNSYSPISAGFETWYWDFGDGNDSTYFAPQDTILHRYAFPGVYEVKFGLTATVYGYFMTDTMYQTIEVFEYPFARIDTAGLGVCFGQSIQFNDASIFVPNDPGAIWSWNFDDGTLDTLQNPIHNFQDTGTYQVSLHITSQHGCTAIDSTPAYVNFSPSFDFLIKNPCLNNPATFIPDYDSSKIEITSWNWNFGDYLSDDNTSTESHPQHIYTRIDNYTVKMKMSSHGCNGESEKQFLVYPVPYSDYNVLMDYGNVQGRVKLTNNSIFATHYLWDFGNGNTSTVPDPVEVYEYDSTYLVTLVAYNDYPPNTTDDFKCSDTTIQEISIFFKGLYFPTAFSPNNPNDEISRFTPKGVNLGTYEVQVFDLKGNLLWESDKLDDAGTPTESWDGYNPDGVLMPQGMYIWKAMGRFKDGTVWTGQSFDENTDPKTNGVVTLIR